MIKSVYDSQDDALKGILELCNLKRFDLDPCYGKGNFYKHIPRPIYCIDKNPQFDFVAKGDASEVIFPENSLNSIIFDPPFLATKGLSLEVADNRNLMAQRFGVFPTEKALFQFYFKCLGRFYVFLKNDGFLIFKCQDKVSSGKQYFSHIYIHEMAISIGFYPKDLIILTNDRKMLGFWQDRKQQHAYKFHSYFWIFQKAKPKVMLEDLLNC